MEKGDLLLKENEVVSTPTKEEYDTVTDILHSLSFKWCNGKTYKEERLWNDYKGETVLNVHEGMYGNTENYKHKILIPAQEFIEKHIDLVHTEEETSTATKEESEPIFECIHEPVFKSFVWVSLNQTDEEFLKSIKENVLPFSEKFLKKWDVVGKGFESCHAITLNSLKTCVVRINNVSIGTIAHEAAHCVEDIYWNLGMSHTRDTSEAFAYMQGYLTESIYNICYRK